MTAALFGRSGRLALGRRRRAAGERRIQRHAHSRAERSSRTTPTTAPKPPAAAGGGNSAGAQRSAASCASRTTTAASPGRSDPIPAASSRRRHSSPAAPTIAGAHRSAAAMPSGRRRAHRTGKSHGTRLDSDFASPFDDVGDPDLAPRYRARADRRRRWLRASTSRPGSSFQRERGTSSYITDDRREIPDRASGRGILRRGALEPRRATLRDRRRAARRHSSRQPSRPLDDPFSPRPAMPATTSSRLNPKISRPRTVVGRQRELQTKLRGLGRHRHPPAGRVSSIAFTDNPSLKPERSRSFEAGVDQALRRRPRAGRSHLVPQHLRRSDCRGRALRPVEPLPDRQHLQRAGASGLEFAPRRVRERTRGVDVQARVTYTFLDSEILAVDQAGTAPPPFTAGQSLLQRPRHQWALDVSFSHRPLDGVDPRTGPRPGARRRAVLRNVRRTVRCRRL